MTETDTIELDGIALETCVIPALAGEGHPNLIAIRCRRGFLMCGYLDLEKAEQLGDAAVRVAGASVADVLANPITGFTPQAAALGVAAGMTGAEAARALSR